MLFQKDREKIETLGKPAGSALIIYHYLQNHPVTDSKSIAAHCKLSLPTAIKTINHLMNINVLTEITGKERNKIYMYKKYIDILNKETILNNANNFHGDPGLPGMHLGVCKYGNSSTTF